MATSEPYRRQVALLLRMLPLVAAESVFALKGGTAINLFIRDMPRLSVDIDLTFLPVLPRPESLAQINAAMGRIKAAILTAIDGATVTRSLTENAVTRLYVSADGAQVKIELSPVLRGTVFDPELRGVSACVEDEFGYAEIPVVSFADLFAGKRVAALDRQHPRDLFDVRDLLANEGLDRGFARGVHRLFNQPQPTHARGVVRSEKRSGTGIQQRLCRYDRTAGRNCRPAQGPGRYDHRSHWRYARPPPGLSDQL